MHSTLELRRPQWEREGRDNGWPHSMLDATCTDDTGDGKVPATISSLCSKNGWIHPDGMRDGHKIHTLHSTPDVEYLLRLGEIDPPATLLLAPHTMPDGDVY